MSSDEFMNIGGNAKARLLGFVERIERLEQEKSDLAEDIKEIYSESKSVGFDNKFLRKVIARRKKDRETVLEEDQMIKVYEDTIYGLDEMME